MREKKFIDLLLAIVICVVSLTGCGKKAETKDMPDTVGYKLFASFEEEIKNDSNLENVAARLTENPAFNEMAMVSMPVEEGYLNGFSDEIKGFKQGVVYAPMIGTIPFIGYIFETDDTAALVDELKGKAQLNWNICTVADEMVVESVDQYVFFVMAPASFDME